MPIIGVKVTFLVTTQYGGAPFEVNVTGHNQGGGILVGDLRHDASPASARALARALEFVAREQEAIARRCGQCGGEDGAHVHPCHRAR
jgi:hypothetical protein